MERSDHHPAGDPLHHLWQSRCDTGGGAVSAYLPAAAGRKQHLPEVHVGQGCLDGPPGGHRHGHRGGDRRDGPRRDRHLWRRPVLERWRLPHRRGSPGPCDHRDRATRSGGEPAAGVCRHPPAHRRRGDHLFHRQHLSHDPVDKPDTRCLPALYQSQRQPEDHHLCSSAR